MSMPISHMRNLLQLALPLLVLVTSTALALWQGYQPPALPLGSSLVLHQSLVRMPAEPAAVSRPLPQVGGKDPFWRTVEAPPYDLSTVVETANLEEIHLTTIAQGKQGRYCIVNGEIFNEKQQGKSFTIETISPDQVSFRTSRQSFVLFPGQRAAIQAGVLVPLEKVAINASGPLMDQENLYE